MISAFRRWKERRYWQKRHLEALRLMIEEDYRWLVDEPVGKAIVERHHRMASTNWYQKDHEPVPQFRERMRKLAAETLEAKRPAPTLPEPLTREQAPPQWTEDARAGYVWGWNACCSAMFAAAPEAERG